MTAGIIRKLVRLVPLVILVFVAINIYQHIGSVPIIHHEDGSQLDGGESVNHGANYLAKNERRHVADDEVDEDDPDDDGPQIIVNDGEEEVEEDDDGPQIITDDEPEEQEQGDKEEDDDEKDEAELMGDDAVQADRDAGDAQPPVRVAEVRKELKDERVAMGAALARAKKMRDMQQDDDVQEEDLNLIQAGDDDADEDDDAEQEKEQEKVEDVDAQQQQEQQQRVEEQAEVREQEKEQVQDILEVVEEEEDAEEVVEAVSEADDEEEADEQQVGNEQEEEGVAAAGDDDEPVILAEQVAEHMRAGMSHPFKPRNLLTARKPNFLIGVITGGKKPSVQTNRQAVIDTWFDEHAYMVTREKVNTDRVIVLSEHAENGGHKGLPRKVKHMFAHMYENMMDDYDWFIKADDDTYINMERFQKTLSVFNPDIPVYFGKPFATKLKGVDGPTPLWKDFTALNFCHGGAGYVISRALMKIVGSVIRDAPEPTSLEDAAVASVLHMYAGVRCINVNSHYFGGFDLVGNSHDQDFIMKQIKTYERSSPKVLIKTATVHSVKADVTKYLNQTYARIKGNTATEAEVDRLAEQDLEERRSYMTTSWNCTLPTALEGAEHHAVCQQSALIAPPPHAPPHHDVMDDTWEVVQQPAERCKVAAGSSAHSLLSWAVLHTSTPPTQLHPLLAVKDESASAAAEPTNAVLVAVDDTSPDTLDALYMLLYSLRATGSTASVVIASALPQAVQDVTQEFCDVTIIKYDPIKLAKTYQDSFSFRPTPDLQSYVVFEGYLHRMGSEHARVLLTPVDTLFQRSPFAAMSQERDLHLFVKNPVTIMDATPCYAGVVKSHEMPTMLSLSTVYGTQEAVRSFFSLATSVSYRARKCSFETGVSIAAFRHEFAVHVAMAIINPWDALVATVRETEAPLMTSEGQKQGRVLLTNLRGTTVAMVTSYRTSWGTARTALTVPSTKEMKTPLSIALDQYPERLHVVIKETNNVTDPTPSELPVDSKAFLRWSKIMEGGSDGKAVQPLFELLLRYDKYKSDPSKPVVTRVASPATHKTGQAALSGVLFRFAARHHLRIFHEGNWPFIMPELLVAPNKAWQNQYDITFSQISSKGQWRMGGFGVASDLYNLVLGKTHGRVMMLEEPKQHYLSWLYFYIIPKKLKFKPLDIVKDFIERKLNKNLLSQEFAIRTQEKLKQFMVDFGPSFDVIFIKERMIECLVLMRRRFNWSLLDVTFLSMGAAGHRFDGKTVQETPRYDVLDADIITKLEAILPIDLAFYKMANERLDQMISEQGADFQEEVAALQKVQQTLSDICRAHQRTAMCEWYRMNEYDFIRMLGPAGYTRAVPIL